MDACSWDHTQPMGLLFDITIEALLTLCIRNKRSWNCFLSSHQWMPWLQCHCQTLFSFPLVPMLFSHCFFHSSCSHLLLAAVWRRDYEMVIRWTYNKRAAHSFSMEKKWLMSCVSNDLFYYWLRGAAQRISST